MLSCWAMLGSHTERMICALQTTNNHTYSFLKISLNMMKYMCNNLIMFITLDSAIYLWFRSISVCGDVTAQLSFSIGLSLVWYGHFREDHCYFCHLLFPLLLFNCFWVPHCCSHTVFFCFDNTRLADNREGSNPKYKQHHSVMRGIISFFSVTLDEFQIKVNWNSNAESYPHISLAETGCPEKWKMQVSAAHFSAEFPLILKIHNLCILLQERKK